MGRGLICSTDRLTGKIFNIEGDPYHPINEGSLGAKDAGLFGLTEVNGRRPHKVLYRAPKSDKWEEKDWNWTRSVACRAMGLINIDHQARV